MYSRKLKKREGMYPEQFHLLQKGDIIRGVNSRTLRPILEVSPMKYHNTYFITLEKIRPSRFNSSTTTYCSCDAFQFVPIRVKDERIWDLTYEVVMLKRNKEYAEYREREIKRLNDKLRALLP